MSDSYLSRDLSSMVGLSRIWLSLGLVVSLMAALLGLALPAGAVGGYGDVPEGTWYTDAVQWSVDNGIAGVAGACFAPDIPVSRGETAVWIYNMENQPSAGVRHPFTDVTDASQDDAVSWLVAEAITTGTTPTTFSPDYGLTRGQFAAFLWRLAGRPSAPVHSFTDVVAGWQQGPVSWLLAEGITTGTSTTTFSPEVTLTRAHLVTFLYRYQGKPDVTINTATPTCDPTDESGSEGSQTVKQYQTGDTIAGFPSGFAAASGNFSGASVEITGGGSTVTVNITRNGSAAYSDTTYTCASVGGCTIVNGRVTKGTINATTSTVAETVPAPDLVVGSPTVDTSAPVVGERFTLSAVVRNQGDGRSATTRLRYFRSTDTTITSGDTSVGTDFVSRLDALETGAESVSVTAPSTPGTYYYGACVDSTSDESDTTNNCSASVAVTVGAAPTPDLVVGSPTVDTSSPVAGERFRLSATVSNLGDGRSASTTLRYYQSTDATITTGDTEVGRDSVFRLDARETGDESINLTAPSVPGTYYYGACVDSTSDESDTTNNCSASVAVTVAALDLLGECQDGMKLQAGQGCNYQGVGTSGAQITVLLSVRNDGAICREGGPIGIISIFKKCDIGGFERDDTFRSDITVEKNSDGSWTFHDGRVPVGAGEVPTVEPRAGTTTELVVRFEDTFAAGETRAYDLALRTKTPQGSWRSGCREVTPSQAATDFVSATLVNLSAGTTYEFRYRYRNSSRCGEGTPNAWSPVGQGTTGDDEPGPSSSVFGAGDTIPGFPSGFGALSGNFRNGVQVSASGGMVTITMSNGGTAEYSHATYTCTSPGGCTIVNGRVTNGTVNATSSTVGAAFTPDLA